MKQIYGVWLPEDDTHFPKMMNEDGTYQRDTFAACMEYVKEPKIFYDVGAHVGLWSLMAIKAGFKVINAYEPNPKTFACLERNLAGKNGEYKAHLSNHGIAEYEDKLKLNEVDSCNSGAVTLSHWYGDWNKNAIDVDNINNKHLHGAIDKFQIKPHEILVKIDTEGMEAECVLGMDKILYALRPVVCVEQRSNENALRILQQMGMQIVNQVRKDYILTW